MVLSLKYELQELASTKAANFVRIWKNKSYDQLEAGFFSENDCIRCGLSNKCECNLHQDGGMRMTTGKLELSSVPLKLSPVSLSLFKAQHE